jgi:RimJ/RimL family protein N-acetyltransferase
MKFNPILLDVSEQIETKRLILRAVMPGDGAVHFAAMQESLRDLRQHLAHLPWVKEEPSLLNSEKFCRTSRSRFIQRESMVYFIYLKSDQSFIGDVGLHRIEWDIPKVEIGYWCRSGAQGNGYIVEAVKAITEFSLTQLAAKRIEICADDLNVSSWKVAERAGFELEGILRNASRDGVTDQLRDLRVYSKIRTEIPAKVA